MLIRYQLDDQKYLVSTQGEITNEALASAMWLDLVNPDADERQLVESLYSQPLPETEDVEEIEASARSYQDETGLHVHSLFLHKVDERHRNSSVAFTLTDNQLITLREREIPAFRLMRMRARRLHGLVEDPVTIVLSLFEIKIDDLADTLEEVYTQLENTSNQVLEDNDSPIEDALDAVSYTHLTLPTIYSV